MQKRRYTEARKENNRKWDENHLDRLSLALPKGKKGELQAAAANHGLSVNAYLGRLIDEALEKENRSSRSYGITDKLPDFML